MRNMLSIAALMLATASAHAAPQTITLSVPDMSCPVCPITVKKALLKVEGVQKVNVDFDHREAKVTFDDSVATLNKLTQATNAAGYPSKLKEKSK